MRLLRKLKQYKKIYNKFGSTPSTTTITELSEVLLCSERNASNIIGQLYKSNWLIWNAQAGRGKKATIQCLASCTELSDNLLQEFLHKGDYQSALHLAEGDPNLLQYIISPFLGRKWLQDTPVLRIPYYRTLGELIPNLSSGRTEKHIINSIYSGLVRFENNELTPDIAYKWTCNEDGSIWDFYLRNNLHWHNGQPVAPAHLLESVKMAFLRDDVVKGIPYFNSVSLVNSFTMRIILSKSDFLLPKRLAGFAFKLCHPQKKDIGCGPFRLVEKKPNYIRLEKHSHYHLNHPLVYAIELFSSQQNIYGVNKSSCIYLGEGSYSEALVNKISKPSLGFGFATTTYYSDLDEMQRLKIFSLCHSYIAERYLNDDYVLPSVDLISMTNIVQKMKEINDFPKTLTIAYLDTTEMTNLAFWLRKKFKESNCNADLRKISRCNWHDEKSFFKTDIILGDFISGEDFHMSLDEWFRFCPYWKEILSPHELAIGYKLISRYQFSNSDFRKKINLYINHLFRKRKVASLLRYNYTINTYPGVEGVSITQNGWVDFSKIWINN